MVALDFAQQRKRRVEAELARIARVDAQHGQVGEGVCEAFAKAPLEEAVDRLLVAVAPRDHRLAHRAQPRTQAQQIALEEARRRGRQCPQTLAVEKIAMMGEIAGVHGRQADVPRQSEDVGTAAEHAIGGPFDQEAIDAGAVQLAAGSIGRLVDGDVMPGLGQAEGRGQAADAGADHVDPHGD